MAGMTGSSFSRLIGGGSAGASAGAGAASSGAAAVPIIGWIVAGMMKNAQLFDQGRNIADGESWAGKIATAGAVDFADKGFRGLGLNDKTALILSGSSIHAKLFGRSAPKITGQGITGSYGFGGFDDLSCTDIKAKRRPFRSDKKWTQYTGLDPNINRTFDMAARQVRGASTDLAKQLGVDLSQQQAGVTDEEKLQKTMRELERAVAGGDSGAAQAALGFGRSLYASGKDYNGLYDQVTGLVDGMKVGDLDKDGTSMGQLADTIEVLPDNFARAVFDLVVDKNGQAATTAAVQQSNALLAQVVDRLDRLEAVTTQGVRASGSNALRNSLNR